MDSKIDTRLLGRPDDAIRYLLSIDKALRKVENTHVKVDTISGATERFFSPDLARRWHARRRKGVQWHDLVAGVSDQRAVEFQSWASQDAKRRYFLRVVDANDYLPFLNFMVVTFDDGSREVLFGWSYTHGQPADTDVFVSRDPNLARYFSDYFSFVYQK